MRERLTRCASVSTMVMAVMFSPSVWGQQGTRRDGGEQRAAGHHGEMIHGIIAGITAEGEIFFNHQTNTAVKAEAAFLTVVGSPVHRDTRDQGARSQGAEGEHRAAASGGNDRRAEMAGRRHNVYIVWLTPKTKVCEATRTSGDAEHAKTSGGANASGSDKTSEHGKKECKLEDLEVGDRVEVEFMPEDESSAHNNVHQSQQMSQKHGRDRTHVGYATAITIMPHMEHAQSNSRSDAKSNEGSK